MLPTSLELLSRIWSNIESIGTYCFWLAADLATEMVFKFATAGNLSIQILVNAKSTVLTKKNFHLDLLFRLKEKIVA